MSKRILLGLAVLGILFLGQNGATADLTIGVRSEPAVDPHFLYLTSNIAYNRHVFGHLTALSHDAKLMPDLDTSWKPIDDTHWEVNLRTGVKFHDGSDFTAEDVVFSIKRVPNVPNNPSTYASGIRSIVETRVVNPHKIIFTTDKPNPILMNYIRMIAIVSKKVAENATTADFKSGRAMIGTGPYKFGEYVPGSRYVLERFENHWGEKPAYDKVTFRIICNDAARVAALLGGDVDMIDFVPPTDVSHLKKNKDIHVYSRPSDRIIFMFFDSIRDKSPFVKDADGKPLAQNPLKDLRVRKALSMAINREAICAQVMDGLAFQENQLIPRGWFGYNPDIKFEKFDPAGARKLLAEAGYPKGFGLTVHGPNDRYVNDAKVCQAVAQMLARVGLEVKVETMPQSVYFGKANPPQREFSFTLIGWGAAGSSSSVHTLMTVLHTYEKAQGVGTWNGGYSNPEVDRLIEEAVVILDDARREKALHRAMAAAMEDYAVIPLFAQSTIAATRKGITYTPYADEETIAMSIRPEK